MGVVGEQRERGHPALDEHALERRLLAARREGGPERVTQFDAVADARDRAGRRHLGGLIEARVRAVGPADLELGNRVDRLGGCGLGAYHERRASACHGACCCARSARLVQGELEQLGESERIGEPLDQLARPGDLERGMRAHR